MTEPREPESFTDGEVAPVEQPEAPASPSTATWYPVKPRPEAEEPAAESVPEPVMEPEVMVEPEPLVEGAPFVAPESSAATAPLPAVEPEPVPAVEPVVEAEPVAVVEPELEPVVEPEPEAVVERELVTGPEPEALVEAQPEPEVVVEPEPFVEPATELVVESEPETEVVVAPEPPTLVVPAPEATPTDAGEVGSAEPTVAFARPEFAAAGVAAVTERLDLPAAAPVPPAPSDAIFRQPSPTTSAVAEATIVEPLSEEERKLAAERAARRDARAAALAAPAPAPVVAAEPVIIHKRTNDKFWGSLGLFLLRVVLAGIFAIRGLDILTDIPAAQAQFATTILADYESVPQVMAIVTGVASLLIALSLLLGLLTRVAGLGIALIAGGAVALVYWGQWSPFVAGRPGFLGEYELLLATVGVLLLFIGGGGWSLDRSFRAGRERDKAERAAEGR